MHVLAFIAYFLLALSVGIFSYRKQTSSTNFLIGNRSLNYWLTALAAHASDMSNWLFMGYPAIIFSGGLFNAWVAIGLIVCMFLNWQWVAPKLRILTETSGQLTLSGFFEAKLQDRSGLICLFSGGMCLLFYSIYIAAGLVGLGELTESLLGLPYHLGALLGILIVVVSVLFGGYVTLAWLDLFQGIFLLVVILIIPLILLPKIGGIQAMKTTLEVTPSLIPSSGGSFFQVIAMAFGWGLGYFGQPHILTKFMGIRETQKINQSKWVGMCWMILSLSGATCVGLIGLSFFTRGIENPEMLFIEMVKQTFHPFWASLILCAILAAILNVMSSQILVTSSILSQDLYKKFDKSKTPEKRLLTISRVAILIIACIALIVAINRPTSIFQLVLYAWSGLGAAFGPVVLYTLYGKKITRIGAWVGMLSGGIISAIWPLVNPSLPHPIQPLLPAFLISFGLNWGISQHCFEKSPLRKS